MTCRRYALFGLEFDSEIGLVARPSDGIGPADVTVRTGIVDPVVEGDIAVDRDRVRIAIEDVGRFAVRDGREIIVDPFPQAPPENVRLYLMGSVMGVLLHQRGLLPLHANAIDIKGRAAAFLGESGAGKSTLAAWAHDAGHAVISDDVCVVDFDSQGRPTALPGVPRFRLGVDALAHSGRVADRFPRSFTGDDAFDKRDVAADRVTQEALPLEVLYLLERGAEASLLPIEGAAKVEALFAHTYRGAFVRRLGGEAEHWRQCVVLADRVPMFRFVRRWSPNFLAIDAHAALDHAAGLAPARSAASRK